jgi:hypothetical protein
VQQRALKRAATRREDDTPMSKDLERLNRLLDDLAVERDVAERAALCAADVELAQTAAFLKAVDAARLMPRAAFVQRLGAQLAAAHQNNDQSGSRPADRAVEVSGALDTADGGSLTPSPARHSTAQRDT